MEKIYIEQVSVFESTEGIYISRGDHSLVNVKGKDAAMVLNVIKAFRESNESEAVYRQLREKYGIEESYYYRLLNWLVNNRIVRTTRPDQAQTLRRVTVIGQFENAREIEESYLNPLSRVSKNQYALRQYVDVRQDFDPALLDHDTDLVLYFSPLFEHYERFKKINKALYEGKFNCVHIGIDETTYTIGPFVLPELSTPCLKCYTQRKMVNMSNPDEYVKFISGYSLDQVTSMSLTSIRHFGLLVEHSKLQLEDYFNTGRSELIGKSMVVNLFEQETRISKVLRVPTCEVCCGHENIFSPFN